MNTHIVVYQLNWEKGLSILKLKLQKPGAHVEKLYSLTRTFTEIWANRRTEKIMYDLSLDAEVTRNSPVVSTDIYDY